MGSRKESLGMQEENGIKHTWAPNTLPTAPGGLMTTHPWEDIALGERAQNVHIGPAVTAKSTTG